jgi:putative ABC transport system substrate-binding protein
MKRRDFIAILSGAAAAWGAWPLTLRAQQSERLRRVGILMTLGEDDTEGQRRVNAFVQNLQELGWIGGRNVSFETRWGAGDSDRSRTFAAEMAALGPDVILAPGSVTVAPLLQATRSVPIVFVHVPDPVSAGFVDSLARPGGNATGFTQFEFSLAGKWLEFLKEISPTISRVGVLRDPTLTTSIAQFAAMQTVAPALGVDLVPLNARDAGEIERTVAAFARVPHRGLVVSSNPFVATHRALIITLAAQHKIPAIFVERLFASAGGLMSYGPDFVDQFKRAAAYVDRILKGEKPADLPVQAPTRYELVINLKTAKALGLTIPSALLARADEVIE